MLIPTSNHPPRGNKYRSSNSTNVCAIFIGSMACRVHVLEVDSVLILSIDCDLNDLMPRVVISLVLLVSCFELVVIVLIIWGPPIAFMYIKFPSHRSGVSIAGVVVAGVGRDLLEVIERDGCLLSGGDDPDADLAVRRPGHGIDDGDEQAVHVRGFREADERRLDALGEPAGGSRSVGGGSRSVGGGIRSVGRGSRSVGLRWL